jgi:TetR/AcrR family transcriptional regulator, cholesterol catabolism regulator
MLSKATALFWKKGYNATSMRDIAKAYGCKPANIYNFFSNKEEILFEVLQEEMEQILAPVKHLEEDASSDPVDQLKLFIESFAKLALRYRRSSKLLFDVALENLSVGKRREIIALRDRFDGILRTVIRRGKDAGCFGDVDEKLASHMIASMVVRSRMWFQPGKGLTESEVAEFIFNFTLNALRGFTERTRGSNGRKIRQ